MGGVRGARRVLVAEDVVVIALDVGDALRQAGWEVVGPVARADEAARLAAEAPLDAAVLDIDLVGGPAYPAADALVRRGVPFVFLTGYGPAGLPGRFRGRPVLGKPCAAGRLPAALEVAEREQRVRGRAYAIWEDEGRPEGEAVRHWAVAEAELRDEEQGEAVPSVASAETERAHDAGATPTPFPRGA
jgi:CheY-like chemotaxis protein